MFHKSTYISIIFRIVCGKYPTSNFDRSILTLGIVHFLSRWSCKIGNWWIPLFHSLSAHQLRVKVSWKSILFVKRLRTGNEWNCSEHFETIQSVFCVPSLLYGSLDSREYSTRINFSQEFEITSWSIIFTRIWYL